MLSAAAQDACRTQRALYGKRCDGNITVTQSTRHMHDLF